MLDGERHEVTFRKLEDSGLGAGGCLLTPKLIWRPIMHCPDRRRGGLFPKANRQFCFSEIISCEGKTAQKSNC